MRYDNYGDKKDNWVVDHIIPVSSFDFNNASQIFSCFNNNNLQPLWFVDNSAKSNKIL